MISVINSAAILILASIAALWTELAGCLCIAIEGFMIFGAFFGFVLAGWTGSAVLGALLCAVFTAFLGYVLVIFIEKTGSNLFISGLAINLAAEGITTALSKLWFGTGGVLRDTTLLASQHAVRLFGGAAFSVPPFALSVFLVIVLSFLFVKTTIWGRRLKAVGLSPAAAREHGIEGLRYRAGSWAAAGFLAALAGAALSFRVAVYAPGGTAGRGWLGLSAVFLGGGDVLGTTLAAVLFAVVEYLTVNAQKLSVIPATALLGLPQFTALVLYVITARIKRGKKQ